MTAPRRTTALSLTFILAALVPALPAEESAAPTVTRPTPEQRADYPLPDFYEKLVLVGPFAIVGSERVRDPAMLEAAWIIGEMLRDRGDVLAALAAARVRCAVMAFDEFTTDIPEHADLEPARFWNRRARGLGSTPQRPCVSCGEENLLRFKGDPYFTESILVHEFAHAIHEQGLDQVDPTFDGRLEAAYDAAMKAGLWEGKYAATNHREYWAEAVQSFFDTNRENDHDHNHVNTREELKEYDPALHDLVAEVFRNHGWRFTRPESRFGTAHLAGYDPESAPTFEWPEELRDATASPADR